MVFARCMVAAKCSHGQGPLISIIINIDNINTVLLISIMHWPDWLSVACQLVRRSV